MKKKNLNHNGLSLNKKVISSLESGVIKGGGTNSCFIDVDTRCAKTVGCNFTNACPTGACPTDTCDCPSPTDNTCILSISCPQNGIC
ncbi:hypothetical protein H2O64_02235 [Kordia sp. YSTF-M3]|uniref:Bacteriocin n=1 Tax=Kordia aestuariivivens TaxID=2759037 RepID=A0ABR7Q4M4_9FLAO|nr:hypothetical protein [Kordia aestuariivivens]MBC8753472.1 hypothetical protein [Kordia aestuariivivens]